jgi:hypothetical protein
MLVLRPDWVEGGAAPQGLQELTRGATTVGVLATGGADLPVAPQQEHLMEEDGVRLVVSLLVLGCPERSCPR